MIENELELLAGAETAPEPIEDEKPTRRRKVKAAPMPEGYEAARAEYFGLIAARGLPEAWQLMWPDAASVTAAPEAAAETMQKLLDGVRRMTA